jgi:hypothetical protein
VEQLGSQCYTKGSQRNQGSQKKTRKPGAIPKEATGTRVHQGTKVKLSRN